MSPTKPSAQTQLACAQKPCPEQLAFAAHPSRSSAQLSPPKPSPHTHEPLPSQYPCPLQPATHVWEDLCEAAAGAAGAAGAEPRADASAASSAADRDAFERASAASRRDGGVGEAAGAAAAGARRGTVSGWSHAGPAKPYSHSHCPSAPHRPRPEQLDGQRGATREQSVPSKPLSQMQRWSTPQRPWALQALGQPERRTRSHWSPPYPSSHAQRHVTLELVRAPRESTSTSLETI